jgi:small subunit ribosomal protein S19
VSRSVWKGPYVDVGLLFKVVRLKRTGKLHQMIKTWARGCTIIPEFFGVTFLVHNGKSFVPVAVNNQHMIGHKLGEFAPTRLFKGHGGGK